MKYIVSGIKVPPDYCGNIDIIKQEAIKKLGVSYSDILSTKIIKESIDARNKRKLTLVYSIMVELKDSQFVSKRNDIIESILKDEHHLVKGIENLNERPIIIGSGPAGLFAGYTLAKHGYCPVILERGECVDKRAVKVADYWKTAKLDTESNVQFGEGGAGTFSDGKLTTRINDARCEVILKIFHQCGADSSLLYKAKPHIGSDVLHIVVKNLRKKIIEMGGAVVFNSKATGLIIENNEVKAVVVNEDEVINAGCVVLAPGHSARDTFKMLYTAGVRIIPKAFSIGVRIEHLQSMIDESQYGEWAGHPALGPAEYFLSSKANGRGVYSFCMCPGGIVTASATEKDTIVTNGMSNFARNGQNANSALVVSVTPNDFLNSNPLSGIDYQRKWERLAYKAGGNDGAAPAQTIGNLINGKENIFKSVKPCYTGAVKFTSLDVCLPGYVIDSIAKAIPVFNNKVKGFGSDDAVMTGVETRTSSPLRLPRGDSLEAVGIGKLYPAGEGAGYAGGIISAAVDGMRAAEKIISIYKPLV